jgi:hypothetical protein
MVRSIGIKERAVVFTTGHDSRCHSLLIRDRLSMGAAGRAQSRGDRNLEGASRGTSVAAADFDKSLATG